MSSSTSSSPPPTITTDGNTPTGSRIVRIDSITLGQQVASLAVRLHVAPSSTSDSTNVSESGARSRKKAKGALSTTSKKVTPKIVPVNSMVGVSSQNGFVRVLLTDATASIIAEVPTPSMNQLSKDGSDALSVLVDGCAEMCEGKLILRVSSLSLDASAASLPVHRSIAPLLNSHSSMNYASGIWLFRLIANEVFVLCRPVAFDEEGASFEPPYVEWKNPEQFNAAVGQQTDHVDLPIQFAMQAVSRGTCIKQDEYVIMHSVRSAPFLHTLEVVEEVKMKKRKKTAGPPKRLLTHMVCGLVMTQHVEGDNAAESTGNRDHWLHVARAIHDLPPQMSESLTQVVTVLSSMFDHLCIEAGIDAETDLTGEDSGDQGLDAPLYDENDKMIIGSDDAWKVGDDDVVMVEAPPKPYTTRELLQGFSSSSPIDAKRFLQTYSNALTSAQEKLHKLREESEQNEGEDDEVCPLPKDEDEDDEEEDGEASADEDTTMNGATGSSAKKMSARSTPTSASEYVGRKKKKVGKETESEADQAAKVSKLTSEVRALKKSIARGDKKKIPITVLTGFLGAGKTTLLNHLLTSEHGLRIGVIVNDFSHVNVDASLIKSNQGAEQLVELSNGCICCTLRGDLFRSVTELVASGSIDYLCIESTGIGEPAPIVSTFTFDVGSANSKSLETYGLGSLSEIVELDTITTVVDTQALYDIIQQGHKRIAAGTKTSPSAAPSSSKGTRRGSRKNASTEDDATLPSPSDVLTHIQGEESSAKSIHTLLIEQLEFCNVLVLNKSDLVTPNQRKIVSEFVRLINVKAEIIQSSYGKVEPKQIIGAKRFSDQESMTSPLLAFAAAEWHASLTASNPLPGSESEEYGVTSFVYHRRVGFDGERLEKLLAGFEDNSVKEFAGLLRVKGVFWINTNDTVVGLWQSTRPGTRPNISHVGTWLLDMCSWDCVTSGFELNGLARRWHSVVSDRYTQIVFIGVGIDRAAIEAKLDECCLNHDQLKQVIYEEDGEEDEEEEEEEEDTNAGKKTTPSAAKDSKSSPQFKLLKTVVEFNPNEPTCGI